MSLHRTSAARRGRGRAWLLGGALACAGGLCGVLGIAAPPAAQPVCTSKAKFRIPFQFDSEEMARLGAVEIQLHVSTDQGRRWQHAQSVSPAEGRFTFEAPGEGHFTFAVRTVDAQNQFHPAGPLQGGLQVVVDQTPPTLQLQLRESAPGEVELTWSAADDYLDLASLRLEFLDANTPNWQPVGITPAESGRTKWSVSQGGRVLVRGTVADRAGTNASAEAATTLQAARPGQAQPAMPDFSQPVAGPRPPAVPGEGLANIPSTRIVPPGTMPTTLMPIIQPLPVGGQSPARIIAGFPPEAQAQPATRNTAAQTKSNSEGARRVNTTKFNINYQVDEVGPSGVGGVDLYITEDHGGKWFLYGTDEDRQSPIAVEVPRDGQYGFALRARSGVGLAQDPPQPGDVPAINVIVDRRPPQVELKPLRQVNPRQIEIAWTATDEALADLPIAISCAERPTGPWRQITGWRENDGQFTWTIDAQASQHIYVRLEVRDAAGNIARVDAPEPLIVDLTRPTARIVDVESVETPRPQ